MTPDRQRGIALAAARIAGAAVALLALILVADYSVARIRAPKDEARILGLQKQVQAEASLAPRLAAEQDAITQARRARKARLNVLSIFLIAAAAVFIGTSKWLIAAGGPRPSPANRLVRLAIPPVSAASPLALQSPAVTADAIDLAFVDRIVEKNGTARDAAIPILQAIQAHYRYLPDEALQRVCELTEVTPAQIAGTSSFYARFRRSQVGRHVVRVCHGTACHVSGARQITEELRRQLRIPEGADTDPERRFTVDEVACLGCCSLAPVLMVDEHTAGRLTPAGAFQALRVVEQKEPV